MYRGQLRSFCSGAGLIASGASSGGGVRASEASGGGVWRAKRAAGGAAGRPRIVAEGDVLRVYIYISYPLILYFCLSLMHAQTSEPRRLRIGM